MTIEEAEGLAQLKNDFDWQQAFAYAEKPNACEGAIGCVTTSVLLDEVTEIVAFDAGENDGATWIIVGRVKDGRCFYLEAGCDYTGWDCQASGSCWVSNDLGNLIQFGVGEDERARLKLGDHA